MNEKRYYIAYGSNLNVRQMRMRCPHATILGTANLKDWELLFKGSRTGSYLTIEECENGTVPVVIWEVTAADEADLLLQAGYPSPVQRHPDRQTQDGDGLCLHHARGQADWDSQQSLYADLPGRV